MKKCKDSFVVEVINLLGTVEIPFMQKKRKKKNKHWKLFLCELVHSEPESFLFLHIYTPLRVSAALV